MIGVTGSSMESMIYFTLASAMVTALAQIMNIIVGDFREKAINLKDRLIEWVNISLGRIKYYPVKRQYIFNVKSHVSNGFYVSPSVSEIITLLMWYAEDMKGKLYKDIEIVDLKTININLNKTTTIPITIDYLPVEHYPSLGIKYRLKEKDGNNASSNEKDLSVAYDKDVFITIGCDKFGDEGEREINNFIEHIKKLRNDKGKDIDFIKKSKIFLLNSNEKTPTANNIPFWSAYNFKSNKYFDNLFFDDKNKIKQFIYNFRHNKTKWKRIGKQDSASIFLYGEPGTGKTSVFKAIVNQIIEEEGEDAIHVFVIKLGNIVNNEHLINVYNDPIIRICSNCTGERLSENDIFIPGSKRLYLIEDVDVDLDLIKERETSKKRKDSEDENDTNKTLWGKQTLNSTNSDEKIIKIDKDNKEDEQEKKSKKAFMEMFYGLNCDVESFRKEKFTKDCLLACMDGPIEANGQITVMNTNHHEDIDPAFTRAGRMDLKLHLGKLSSNSLKELIYYCYELDEKTMDNELAEKISEFTDKYSKRVNPSTAMIEYLSNKTVEEYMESLSVRVEEAQKERIKKEENVLLF